MRRPASRIAARRLRQVVGHPCATQVACGSWAAVGEPLDLVDRLLMPGYRGLDDVDRGVPAVALEERAGAGSAETGLVLRDVVVAGVDVDRDSPQQRIGDILDRVARSGGIPVEEADGDPVPPGDVPRLGIPVADGGARRVRDRPDGVRRRGPGTRRLMHGAQQLPQGTSAIGGEP